MVMELGHLSPSYYPRTVNASMEGQLRQDGQQRGASPESTSSIKKGVSAAVQRERNQLSQREQSERRLGDERSTQSHVAEQAPAFDGFAESANFGNRLAVASRQARQTHAKRDGTSPAVVSAKGREANRRYLDTALSNQTRFVDELV